MPTETARFSVELFGKDKNPVPIVKDLCVYLDLSLLYKENITNTVSLCMYKLLQDIFRIWGYIPAFHVLGFGGIFCHSIF